MKETRVTPRPVGRVADYEWMRLLATVLVVVGHSMYWVITTGNGGVYYGSDELAWIAPVYQSWPFALVNRAVGWAYSFHMAAFFFLSGAVLALRPTGKPGPFLLKKAKRLLVPYLVCGFVWMFPAKRITGFYTAEKLPAALKAFLLGVDDGGHLWFLTALFWCMVLILVYEHTLLPLLRRRWLAAAALLAAGAALHLFYQRIPGFFGWQSAAQYFLWFGIGYVFEPLRAALAQLAPGRWLVLHAGGFALVTAVWTAGVRRGFAGGRTVMLLGCLWLYLLAALCARCLRRAEDTRLYRTVAASLFWVYLVHDPLEHLLLHFFMENRWLATAAGCWAYLAARTVGAFAFSVAVYVLWRLIRNKLWSKQKDPAPQAAEHGIKGKEETI